MIYAIAIVSLVICGLFIWGIARAFDTDRGLLGGICIVFAAVFAIVSLASIGNMIAYADYKANEVARVEWRIEERTILVTMLSDIGTLMENDITASDTYLTIYKEAVEFNKNVREANTWGGTIWEGVLCDPSYAELDVIPLN